MQTTGGHFFNMKSKKPSNNICILALFLFVIVSDQITKVLALNNLSYGEELPVTSNFNLFLIFNTGAAFSIISDGFIWQKIILIFFPVLVVLFFFYTIYFSAQKQTYFKLGICLIAGGAFGNLIDRILYGYVIDFIDLYVSNYHWPAFNVADSSITIGAGIIIFHEINSTFASEVANDG